MCVVTVVSCVATAVRFYFVSSRELNSTDLLSEDLIGLSHVFKVCPMAVRPRVALVPSLPLIKYNGTLLYTLLTNLFILMDKSDGVEGVAGV